MKCEVVALSNDDEIASSSAEDHGRGVVHVDKLRLMSGATAFDLRVLRDARTFMVIRWDDFNAARDDHPSEGSVIGIYKAEAEVSDDQETITLTLRRRHAPTGV